MTENKKHNKILNTNYFKIGMMVSLTAVIPFFILDQNESFADTILFFDFTSATGWTTTDAARLNVNTGTEKIDFNTDGAFLEQDNLVYDIGVGNISDTAWTLRFQLNVATFLANSPDIQELTILLSDNTANYALPNDSIGINVRVDSLGSFYQANFADGVAPTSNTQNFAHLPTVETVYVQIVRTSATTATVTLYSDSAYTTPIESSQNLTIPSTITGLRYIKLQAYSEDTAIEFNGTIDDLQVILPTTPCNGLAVTIAGNSSNNVIVGTPGNDVISGLGGNDLISGMGGDDTICGGDGDDMIFGNEGKDFIDGDAGKDLLSGNSGIDELRGSAGDDRLIGGSENDILKGNAGSDMLVGEAGEDSLNGGNDFDICDGGSETNTIAECEL